MHLLTYLRVLLITFSLYTFKANACYCVSDEYLTIEKYNKASVIVSGRIIQIDTIDRFSLAKVHLQIQKLYKGKSYGETIIVYSKTIGSCALKFHINEDWLIFATYTTNYMDDTMRPALFIEKCTRSCAMNKNSGLYESNLYFLNQLQQSQHFFFDQHYLTTIEGPAEHTIAGKDTLYAKGEIRNGQPVGKWFYYRKDKSLFREDDYSESGMLQKSTAFHLNGYIKSIEIYDQHATRICNIWYDESGNEVTIVKEGERSPDPKRARIYYIPSGGPLRIKFE